MAKKSKVSPAPARSIGPAAAAQPEAWYRQGWLWGLILFTAVVVAYLPVWWADFIWDDDLVITGNPCIIGPLGLKEIWTTSAADICPLTLTSFWFEHKLWGIAPLGYHLVNVVQHGLCAVLLWRVLRRLLIPGAWLGAALWALHPVQVESVAWAIELKNTQSCLFFLLSSLYFLRGLKDKAFWTPNYGLTLLFAAAAMTSKSSTVILPVALLLAAWWLERDWKWRRLLQVAPIFLFSLAATVLSVMTQTKHGFVGDNPAVRNWPERLAMAGDNLWFYLGKLLWPHPLVTVYPQHPINPGHVSAYLPLAAALALLALVWVTKASWGRPFFFAFAYFVLALLPVLGLVDITFFRYSFVADHFQYLASIGPLTLLSSGLALWISRSAGFTRWLPTALSAGLLLTLGSLTWDRSWAYENPEALWTDTLAKNPGCWVGHNDLGNALAARGQRDEAIAHFREAVRLNPRYTEAHNNLGNALADENQLEPAMAEYRAALAINPHIVEGHYNLGNALYREGRSSEAIAEYREAIAVDPSIADVHYNLGTALFQNGNLDAAITEFRQTLALNPAHESAANNLGNVLLQKGRVDEAIAAYRQALAIDPNYGFAHYNLGRALVRKGDASAALPEFQRSLEIDPRDGDAYRDFGGALALAGQPNAAIEQYEKALAFNRANAAIYDGLGAVWLQKGNRANAAVFFRAALKLKPNDPAALEGLARTEKSSPRKP